MDSSSDDDDNFLLDNFWLGLESISRGTAMGSLGSGEPSEFKNRTLATRSALGLCLTLGDEGAAVGVKVRRLCRFWGSFLEDEVRIVMIWNGHL